MPPPRRELPAWTWLWLPPLVPAWRAMQGVTYAPEQWRCWFWPTAVCAPVSALAILSMVPEWIKDLFGLPPAP